jgi:hypothetical protein
MSNKNKLARVVGRVSWSADVVQLLVAGEAAGQFQDGSHGVQGSKDWLSAVPVIDSMLRPYLPQRVLRSSSSHVSGSALSRRPLVQLYRLSATALHDSGSVTGFKAGLKFWLHDEAYGRSG